MIPISIIISMHNAQAFITASIESLRRQSLTSFECLIVDDFSEDNSVETATAARAGDSRFYIVKSPILSGIGSCWNLGLLHSSGEFVQFMNPGDILAPDALETRLKILAAHSWPGVAGVRSLCEPVLRGCQTRKTVSSDQRSPSREVNPISPPPCAVLLRRKSITELCGFNEFAKSSQTFPLFLDKLSYNDLRLIKNDSVDCFCELVREDPPIPSREEALGKSELTALSRLCQLGSCSIGGALPKLAQGAPIDMASDGSEVDLLFFPQNRYHVVTILAMREELARRGITFAVIDIQNVFKDEGARQLILSSHLPMASVPELVFGAYTPKAVAVFNDWDLRITRKIAVSAKRAGIPGIAIVEGIQDYKDVDTGTPDRKPYQTCEYVITPCKFDLKYFDRKKQHVYEGSIPRIHGLAAQAPNIPYNPDGPVVINANFSYNDKINAVRDMWVKEAVSACQELGRPYAISKHPFDQASYSGYNVTKKSMYDAIWEGSAFVSRFGSGIIEAIAMNRPPIYFNPHNEKVDKFKNPMGAFYIANNRDELKKALIASTANTAALRQNWDDYLEMHAGYVRANPGFTLNRVVDALEDIINSVQSVSMRQRRRFAEELGNCFKKSGTLNHIKKL